MNGLKRCEEVGALKTNYVIEILFCWTATLSEKEKKKNYKNEFRRREKDETGKEKIRKQNLERSKERWREEPKAVGHRERVFLRLRPSQVVSWGGQLRGK